MDWEIVQWLQTRAPHFETTQSGRVRCNLNGSEFVPRLEVLEAFEKGKKFKRLKQQDESLEQLKQFEPFFVRSKNFEDKVYCMLTGQLMGVSMASVKMHTEGKKFKKAKEMFMNGTMELKPEPEISEIMEELERDAEGKKEEETIALRREQQDMSQADDEDAAMDIDDSSQEMAHNDQTVSEKAQSKSKGNVHKRMRKRKAR